MTGLYKLATYLLVLSETSWLAKATYSIVATDSATKQVGGAGASCLPGENIGNILYHSVPGKGVLHTQGSPPLSPTSEAVLEALDQIGTQPPADILDTMKTLDNGMELAGPSGIDAPDYEFRQNAIADVSPVAAGFTGSALEEAPGEQKNRGLTTEGFAYQVLGSGVSNGTVSFMSLAFLGLFDSLGKGCDLADKLMIALEVVSATNNGDLTCIDQFGTPAAGAFLSVDAADGSTLARFDVVGDGTTDPTIQLRNDYNAWRAMNSCPGGTPVEPPTEMPVVAPTDVPVESPTDAPVDAPTNAPVDDPTDAPVDPPTEAPTSGGNVLKQVVLTTVFVAMAVFGVSY